MLSAEVVQVRAQPFAVPDVRISMGIMGADLGIRARERPASFDKPTSGEGDRVQLRLVRDGAPSRLVRDGAPSQEDRVADLFRQHAPALTRLAGLLTSDRSAAEEIVQDAFVGLHRKFGEIRDPDLALGYLRTSVVNGSRSKLRRRRTERAHIPPYLPPAASAEDGAMAREEHALVRAGLRQLPRRQREVLVLRYHLELSEAEIAEALGISRGSVKGYASRALAALGTHLEESR